MKAIHSILRQKHFLFLLNLLIISLFFASINAVFVSAQTKGSKEKIIKKLAWGNEPIEIINLKNNEKTLKIDETFEQDTDWLKDFGIKYKNNSGKNIIWLSVALDFPETRESGNIMAFTISTGRHPLIPVKSTKPIKPGEPVELTLTPTQPVQSIKPSETIELTLDPENYERLKTFIGKRHSLDSLSEVALRISFILYDDGTGWTAGEKVKRSDPNHPYRWIPFDAKEQE